MFYGVIVLAVFICLFSSCKKDSKPSEPVGISVASISPDAGPHSTVVKISGKNFSETVSGNEVRFNGVLAEVLNASSTELTVKVPKRAGTGKVTVAAAGKSADGPVFNFKYTVTVSTVAGNGVGLSDGKGNAAKFFRPQQMAFDKDDNLYVIDQEGRALRKVLPDGTVSTDAGAATAGFADGTGTQARFNGINDVCVDRNTNNLYIAEFPGNIFGVNAIRKITPDGNAGKAVTIAGGPDQTNDASSNMWGHEDNANIRLAKFRGPKACATDADGNLYILDYNNYCIRKMSFGATGVTTLAGHSGELNYADGMGTAAKFGSATDIISVDGNLVVADFSNYRMRRIELNGKVTTLAGDGTSADKDGTGTGAAFAKTAFAAADKEGNIYVVSGANFNTIRVISKSSTVSTVNTNDAVGYKDGNEDEARFSSIMGIAVNSKNELYVSDYGNSLIRKVVIE